MLIIGKYLISDPIISHVDNIDSINIILLPYFFVKLYLLQGCVWSVSDIFA